MAITLTIELSDELEKQVIVQAKQRLVSPEKIVLQCLSQTLTGNQTQREGPQSTELSSIKSDLTQDELEASHQSLLKFAGAISLGHATGLDNHSNEQDYYKGNLCSAMRSNILSLRSCDRSESILVGDAHPTN